MSRAAEKRLRELRCGLHFCSGRHRPVIEAMIARLVAEDDEIPERAAVADVPPINPAGTATAAGDWRAARRALRAAGHEVRQLDGHVYVDGERCDDRGLYP